MFNNLYLQEVCKTLPDSNGISCAYYKQDDFSGLKVFVSKNQIDMQYKYQSKLSRLGLAPEILSDKYVVSYEDKTKYCFLTQHIDTVIFNLNPDKKGIEKIKNGLLDLVESYASVGYSIDDIHSGNFALDEDGKVWLLDFGCTMEYSAFIHRSSIEEINDEWFLD